MIVDLEEDENFKKAVEESLKLSQQNSSEKPQSKGINHKTESKNGDIDNWGFIPPKADENDSKEKEKQSQKVDSHQDKLQN